VRYSPIGSYLEGVSNQHRKRRGEKEGALSRRIQELMKHADIFPTFWNVPGQITDIAKCLS